MKKTIRYIFLAFLVCLPISWVNAQVPVARIIKSATKGVKVPRLGTKINKVGVVAHEVKAASDAYSNVKNNTIPNLKLPNVKLPPPPHIETPKNPQFGKLSSLLSAQGLFMKDSLVKEMYISRFLNYARTNSQSTDNEDMTSFPLTYGQQWMAEFVERELSEIAKINGKLQVVCSESKYVYAKLPATTKKKLPSIMLMAHLDVTPEAPGGNIKPIVHRNYQGGDITLPSGIVLSPNVPQGKHLKECIGKTIITSDGTTLLGADDKTGCTILMMLIRNLVLDKSFEHGDLYFVFSQNEDIGRAAEKFETKYVDGSPEVVIDVDGDDPHSFSVAAKSSPFVEIEASSENLQSENIAYTIYPTLPEIIKKAYASIGKKVSPRSERGGTTSAMIAVNGLRGGACLFSGQQAEHSVYEWTCVEDMMDMTKILLNIIMQINK